MIAESTLDAIRRVDPFETVAALGLDRGAIRQSGGVLVLCPAHGDKTPSNSITHGPDGTLRSKCFACDFAGDVFALVAQVEGLNVRADFANVARRAGEIFGIGVEDGERKQARPRPAFVPTVRPRLETARFGDVIRPIAHLGRLDGRGLSVVATEYLAGRWLLADAIADGWFAIGAHCGDLLIDMFGLELVKQTGLFNERGQLTHSTYELGIPWRNIDGEIDTVQRRRLDGSNEKKYLFPSGRGALLPYGIDRLSKAANDCEVVLTEGAIDVLARRRAFDDGRIVLGCAGTSWAPANGWESIVKDRVVRIAFDADKPGDAAAEKLAPELHDAGASRVFRERPIGANDWAELIAGRRRSEAA